MSIPRGEGRGPQPAAKRRVATERGQTALQFELPWRIDGGTDDPSAPLVLALHGQGMNEDSFALLLQRLFALPCRFLLPRAPWPFEVRRESRIGASWYPYDGDPERFRTELARTEALVLAVLRDVETRRQLRPRRRVLLGFSQGGYCGAVLALRRHDLFSGLIVSGARVKTEILAAEIDAAGKRGFRALLCHGRRDAAVPFEAAAASGAALVAGGVATEWAAFDSGHSLGRAQVERMGVWLGQQFALPSGGASEPPGAT